MKFRTLIARVCNETIEVCVSKMKRSQIKSKPLKIELEALDLKVEETVSSIVSLLSSTATRTGGLNESVSNRAHSAPARREILWFEPVGHRRAHRFTIDQFVGTNTSNPTTLFERDHDRHSGKLGLDRSKEHDQGDVQWAECRFGLTDVGLLDTCSRIQSKPSWILHSPQTNVLGVRGSSTATPQTVLTGRHSLIGCSNDLPSNTVCLSLSDWSCTDPKASDGSAPKGLIARGIITKYPRSLMQPDRDKQVGRKAYFGRRLRLPNIDITTIEAERCGPPIHPAVGLEGPQGRHRIRRCKDNESTPRVLGRYCKPKRWEDKGYPPTIGGTASRLKPSLSSWPMVNGDCPKDLSYRLYRYGGKPSQVTPLNLWFGPNRDEYDLHWTQRSGAEDVCHLDMDIDVEFVPLTARPLNENFEGVVEVRDEQGWSTSGPASAETPVDAIHETITASRSVLLNLRTLGWFSSGLGQWSKASPILGASLRCQPASIEDYHSVGRSYSP